MDDIFHLGPIHIPITNGSRPWIAEITGEDPTYGLRREFLPKRFENGGAVFTLSNPGLYQYKDIPVPSYPGSSERTLAGGFFHMAANGHIESMSQHSILAWLKVYGANT